MIDAARKRRTVSGLVVVCLALFYAGATQSIPTQAIPTQGLSTEADPAIQTGRVSDIQGSLAVRGEAEDDISYAERNTLIRPRDTLWTSEKSYGEIELDSGSWLRLASNTKLESRQLPPGGDFRLWAGSVYFQMSSGSVWPLRLKTPAGEVEVYPGSVVRVDLVPVVDPTTDAVPDAIPAPDPEVVPVTDPAAVVGDESVRVSLYAGRVQVFPDTGPSLRLGAGERVYLKAGQLTAAPAPFDLNETDEFDKYHKTRFAYYAARPLAPELTENVVGARDLHGYGTWTTVERVRYWRPRCAPDWRPYSHGYWSYVPGCGYTWVDYAPWGYATCHYGRWLYRPGYGWLWRPGYRWAPAHVYWSTCGSYYGWAPLDPWGRPCHYGRGNFHSSRFIIDLRSWTFCARLYFHSGRHHRRYAGRERSLYAGIELHRRKPITVRNFHVMRDVKREIGIPHERVRGMMLTGNGVPARERVRKLEEKMPPSRLKLIRTRFQGALQRDRERLQQAGTTEHPPQPRALRGQPATIARSSEASRKLLPQRTQQQPGGKIHRGEKRATDEPHSVIKKHREETQADQPTRVRRPRPVTNPREVIGSDVSGNGQGNEAQVISQGRPAEIKAVTPKPHVTGHLQRKRENRDASADSSPSESANAGRVNRKPEARQDSNKAVNDKTINDRAVKVDPLPEEHHAQPITKTRDHSEDAPLIQRPEKPQQREVRQSELEQPKIEKQENERRHEAHRREAELRAAERRETEQREMEKHKAEQREMEKRKAEQDEIQQREAERRKAQRQEAQREEAQREEAQRQEAQQREVERAKHAAEQAEQNEAKRRAAEQREAQQREAQQREAQQREAQQREAQQREAQQREAQQREAQQRETERREAEQREDEQREAEKSKAEQRKAEHRETRRQKARHRQDSGD